MTIEELRKSGWIVYEYIRGSHAYGLNTPDSDEDHGGVFICPRDVLMGLRSSYVEQVSDEKGDTVFYEFGRWIELLCKSNPNALESLFIPKRCIIGEVHPIIQKIIDNRDLFLSKECFKSLTGYAVSQIIKARGLNKKIVNPITERKTVLDFCYVPWGQGSMNIKDFLKEKGLKQKYCGLANIPAMNDMYALYYDFAAHLITEYNIDLRDTDQVDSAWDRIQLKDENLAGTIMEVFDEYYNYNTLASSLYNLTPLGFSGIVNEEETSNEVRVASVPKYLYPITFMSYNKQGYEAHCRQYKDYTDWIKHRNPVRYENNLGHNYDSKNMMHTLRLLRMGTELAEGKGLNIDRTDIDREYLLKVRNHEIPYENLIKEAEAEKAKMESLEKQSALPDKVDYDKVNKLLIETRNNFYSNYILYEYCACSPRQ